MTCRLPGYVNTRNLHTDCDRKDSMTIRSNLTASAISHKVSFSSTCAVFEQGGSAMGGPQSNLEPEGRISVRATICISLHKGF